MQVTGLIGGMSWESTALYYRLINERVRNRLGGLHSARILLHSVDFAEIERLQRAAAWSQAGDYLGEIATRLEQSGAGCIALCTNTMHKVAAAIEARLSIPFLHIASATGSAIAGTGARRAGLLGTRFTMEEAFYRERLESQYGLQVLVPDREERGDIHRIIYEELCLGSVRDGSRARYREVIRHLADQGAECVILGCTEITLLVSEEDSPVPVFDTTALHAQALADFSLQSG